jgi:hypothetical protein
MNVSQTDIIKIIADRGKESFWYFVSQILSTSPAFSLIEEVPHKKMCDLAQNWKKSKRIFLFPRDTFKTTVLVVAYALWEMVRNPNIKILLSSRTLENSKASLKAIKSVIETHELFRVCYGDLKGEPGWLEDKITISTRTGQGWREPTIIIGGVGTESVGMHFNLILFDDPHDRTNIRTPMMIRDVISYYQGLLPCLDKREGKLQITATRWHHQDLINHCLINEPNNFDIEIKPAYWEENGETVYFFPSRLTEEVLVREKAALGTYFFSCQFLNSPIDDENASFRKDWLRYFSFDGSTLHLMDKNDFVDEKISAKDLNIFVAIDPAGRGTITQQRLLDYTGVVVVGVDHQRRWFILEAWRKKGLRPTNIIDIIIEIWLKYKPEIIGVEEVTFQGEISAGLETKVLKCGLKGRIYTKELRHQNRSKNSRIKGLSPLYEYGRIYHNRNLFDLEDELLRWSINSTVHDDIIDALAYILDFEYPPDDEKEEAVTKLPPLHRTPGLHIQASEEYKSSGSRGTFSDFLDFWSPEDESKAEEDGDTAGERVS